nr:hypothetical protein [Streptomyces sp. NRRL F-5065]
MTDKGVGRDDGSGPWWADLGTWGAVALIGVGGLVAAWVFLRLPGAPQAAAGYHQAARIAAIGLVIVGSALLSRRRSGGRGEQPDQAERP